MLLEDVNIMGNVEDLFESVPQSPEYLGVALEHFRDEREKEFKKSVHN